MRAPVMLSFQCKRAVPKTGITGAEQYPILRNPATDRDKLWGRPEAPSSCGVQFVGGVTGAAGVWVGAATGAGETGAGVTGAGEAGAGVAGTAVAGAAVSAAGAAGAAGTTGWVVAGVSAAGALDAAGGTIGWPTPGGGAYSGSAGRPE